jgi:hypothetical protein
LSTGLKYTYLKREEKTMNLRWGIWETDTRTTLNFDVMGDFWPLRNRFFIKVIKVQNEYIYAGINKSTLGEDYGS